MTMISRRKFTQIVSAAGLAGAALVENMFAEMQAQGSVSPESTRSFIDLSGMKVREDQLTSVQASLERALDSMRRIRDRNVPLHVEPAIMFRVRN
jgi:hypothetical protein